MKKISIYICVPIALLCIALNANALLISASGPNSSAGSAPEIIATPANLLDGEVENTGMQGFNEALGVTTTVAHGIDGGTIAAGTLVDSHMIFLNRATGTLLSHFDVIWTFAGSILGVMSDSDGNLENASTFELGSSTTNYPAGFSGRGLEGNDSYLVSADGFSITVGMTVTQPGDWIRVVTESATPTHEYESATPTPEPATLFLLATGVLGMAGFGRKRFITK